MRDDEISKKINQDVGRSSVGRKGKRLYTLRVYVLFLFNFRFGSVSRNGDIFVLQDRPDNMKVLRDKSRVRRRKSVFKNIKFSYDTRVH